MRYKSGHTPRQSMGDIDTLHSNLDSSILVVLQIAFVGFIILITHKIYTWCCHGSRSGRSPSGGRTSTPPASTSHQGAAGKSREASARSSHSTGRPSGDPPSYDSIYPDLRKGLNAMRASSSARGGIFSWLFGSSGGCGREAVFKRIADQFSSVDEVSNAIRQAGLESSNLIFGIDFTKSNLHTGMQTYGGQSLHTIQPGRLNPYQQVISIIGQTLTPFDDDGLVPVFGFGDLSTQDRSVFPFRQDIFCHGFEDVLECYTRIASTVQLSGPTSFAPLIHQAVNIVKKTKSYHILVIIADGQVNSERETRDAIVAASSYPLSIIMVGVGDGPWDMMREFDDRLPSRRFDNFQFVEFFRVIAGHENAEAAFALNALMEIPDQYKLIRKLGLLDI